MLADGRKLSTNNAEMDEFDTAETVEQLVEKKFLNLVSRLPDDRAAELLARLKAVEECNIAEIFRF